MKEKPMETSNHFAPVSKAARLGGYVMSTLPVLMLLMSAVMKIARSPQVIEGMPQMGYPVWQAVPLGIVELVCTVLYIIPQTAVLGAILLTGYLGGATATHVRMEDPGFSTAVILGVFLWGGLFLRDPRVRALIPFRKNLSTAIDNDGEATS